MNNNLDSSVKPGNDSLDHRRKNSKVPRTRRLLFLLLPVVLLSLAGAAVGAQLSFPKPKGAVNDFAGVIDASSAQKMENLSREVLEKTGTFIVVAVVESIGDNAPADYANRLYQAWGIGKKGEDKGALIFLALKERKIRIETGYGVEGIFPDGLTGEILDRYVVPYLKDGQYGTGLLNGVAAVASVIAKDARVTLSGAPSPPKPRAAVSRRGSPLLPILIVLALAVLLGTRQGRELLPFLLIMFMGGRGGGGGGFGSFGGGFGGFGGGSSGGGGAGRSF